MSLVRFRLNIIMDSISNIRILYIEDDPGLSELFKFVIESLGYAVDLASNGTEGLSLTSENPYDIIVIDYQLPDMTGIDIARKLLADDPVRPLLMVTGKGNERVAVEALQLGISDYIPKGGEKVYLEYIPNKIVHLLETAKLKREQIATELALRQSEQRLSLALSASNAGYWVRDLIAGTIFWSDENARLLGYEPSEVEASFENWASRIHPDERDQISAAMLQKIADHSDINLEYRVQLPGGGIRWINNTGQTIFDAHGEAIIITGIQVDTTGRRQIEEQLRQSQKMEVVGQLTGGVAHDFNNLLGIMIGNTEMLEDWVASDEKAQHHIDALKRAIDRASSLTNRLLAFSRQQPLSPVPTDISKLVIGIEEMLQRTLGETVTLKVKSTPGLWYAVVDPQQLDNALLNLAVNSRDAMLDGGTLTIETENLTLDEMETRQHEDLAAGNYVKLTVSDSGVGMTPEVQARVFEPFFTTKEFGEGSGLGLSMVYGFAKQSKGHVAVNSQEDSGTAVSLFLPAAEDKVIEPEDKLVLHGAVLERKTILLVEDDPEVRETTASMLYHFGYRVIEAEDGIAALETLNDRAHEIDLVFSDVVMPNNMSGVDLAEQISTSYEGVSVLLTSGYPEKITDQDAIATRTFELLAKPYKRAQLIAAIEGYTSKPS